MKKMYRVFVSSTYEDLQDERLKILNALLSISCIPSGMELFSAASEEQFSYIKKVIQDVDYFIIIIAGRYGSIAKDGKSYTQKEFEYAQKLNIPTLAFIHNKTEELPYKYTEQTDIGKEKLSKFKEKVCKNRLVAFWNNGDELISKIIIGLQNEMRSHPQNGWIKNENVDDGTKLVAELQQYKVNGNAQLLYKLYKNRIIKLNSKIVELRNQTKEPADFIGITNKSMEQIIHFVSQCLTDNSKDSLIVIEKIVPLDIYIKTGVDVDAIISYNLINTIFEKSSPLHDGAVIIRDNRIVSAACYLPLSDNPLYQTCGLINRYGIGITEISDSIVIMTTIEKGEVSYAYNGKMHSVIDINSFRKFINQYFQK